MRNLVLAVIVAAAIGFVMAVFGSLLGVRVLGVPPEGWSRACTNLAAIAIALGVWFRMPAPAGE